MPSVRTCDDVFPFPCRRVPQSGNHAEISCNNTSFPGGVFPVPRPEMMVSHNGVRMMQTYNIFWALSVVDLSSLSSWELSSPVMEVYFRHAGPLGMGRKEAPFLYQNLHGNLDGCATSHENVWLWRQQCFSQILSSARTSTDTSYRCRGI